MTDNAPLLERAFEIEVREDSYPLTGIGGRIPDWVEARYYLNGPARFRRGDLDYRHWLDGDGMVSTLRLRQGGAHFANRYVRSTKLVDEEAAGRALYRSFGTSFSGDRLMHGVGLMSPVNVSVYPFGDKLLAFGEQGLPWELDSETLATRGEYTFGGKLNSISPFSAHPNIDGSTGELFNFGVSFSAHRPCINLYRFLADGEMAYRTRLELDFPTSLHDFGISPNYVIFYLSPYVLHTEELLEGGASVMDALRWEPERGSQLLIARREDGAEVARIPVGSRYSLHQINGFERDGRLFVDLIELERPVYDQYSLPDLFPDVRTAQPARYVVDVEGGRLEERRTLDLHLMSDFPAIDPRRAGRDYRRFWMLAISKTESEGRKFFDRLVALDWDSATVDAYQAPPEHYLGGEPVLIGHPDHEERGVVVCQQFSARERAGTFLLFDALDVAAGPIATLPLETPIPLAFHASVEPASASRSPS